MSESTPQQLVGRLESSARKAQSLEEEKELISPEARYLRETTSYSSAADLIVRSLSYSLNVLGEKGKMLPQRILSDLPANALSIAVGRGHSAVVEAILLSIKNLTTGLGKKGERELLLLVFFRMASS